MVETQSKIYLIRTTAGQEKNVVESIYARATAEKIEILSVFAPGTLKGYVFIEALSAHAINEAISGLRHARARVQGVVPFQDVEQYFSEKPVIEELEVGDRVEIIGGLFKKMTAKVLSINLPRNEVTIELEESSTPLPISIQADYLKLVSKASK
ncbi:MAG: transcription elongation factor Spt5 [Candidatus Brockarchaeota archaeon]|nr:transcription elongation factor Spt5 [Candidatus Brockarchaeota archaeon]